MQILVTGGAGFIGSHLVRHILTHTSHQVVNVDVLTYAANPEVLEEFSHSERHTFVQADICDRDTMSDVFTRFQPDAVVHLAAESHVDNSIAGPAVFIDTNVVGTQTLLECARSHWQGLPDERKQRFRYLQVSTDEVYGDLSRSDAPFTEVSPYRPSSPYAASKASADHLVRAWGRTYGLPVLITCCSNNFGPYQHAEKLIPRMISNALKGDALPVYGDGQQIRDWLHVEDHAKALLAVLETGAVGETYNIGANCERTNIQIVTQICGWLEDLAPEKPAGVDHYRDLITFVADRPGHDLRYALNSSKLKGVVGWVPHTTFEAGLRTTVEWYLAQYRDR